MIENENFKGYTQINARVPLELYKRVKQAGIRYARLIELGLEHLERRTNLDQELQELRAGNEKLQQKYSEVATKLFELKRDKEEKE